LIFFTIYVTDISWLEKVASKVSEYIMNNEEFRQIVCDTLSLELIDEVNQLKNDPKVLASKYETLENAFDEQEQYSSHNCLVIYGVPAKENENTDTEAITTFKTYLGIKIKENELDRTHTLGSADRPIIVKFARYNIKKT